MRQVIGGLLMGDLRGMSSMVSEGKSGSLFYWSHDGRYVVKTIAADERGALKDMLHAYKGYVSSHPNTLITKYLGLFDLRVPNTKGHSAKVYHLVIMANVFNTSLSVDERFDLKGSTHGRTVGADLRGTPGLVHKDNDFQEMGRSIALPAHLAEMLKMQIQQDASFLAGHGIIDYSLLLGIHHASVPARPLTPNDGASPRTPVMDAANMRRARAGRMGGMGVRSQSAPLGKGRAARASAAVPQPARPAEEIGADLKRARRDVWVAKQEAALRSKYEQLVAPPPTSPAASRTRAVSSGESSVASTDQSSKPPMGRRSSDASSIGSESSTPASPSVPVSVAIDPGVDDWASVAEDEEGEAAARSTSTTSSSTTASRSVLQPVTSADLRESESRQVQIMKQLETDPDNEALLRQLQEVHHEMVTTVSRESGRSLDSTGSQQPAPQPEPEPEPEPQICDNLTWEEFVEFAFEHSSHRAAATAPAAKESAKESAFDARFVTSASFKEPEDATAEAIAELQPRTMMRKETRHSMFARHQGGMAGTSQPDGVRADEVLFVGIIDTLVPFKMRKKAEHKLKSVVFHGKNFSVIPPDSFRDRFVTANCDIISELPSDHSSPPPAAPPAPAPVRIVFSVSAADGRKFEGLRANTIDTVASVKAQLYRQEGIEEGRLGHNGELLQDEQSLAECGVADGAELELHQLRSGQMVAPTPPVVDVEAATLLRSEASREAVAPSTSAGAAKGLSQLMSNMARD